jgi:hypothetical protein
MAHSKLIDHNKVEEFVQYEHSWRNDNDVEARFEVFNHVGKRFQVIIKPGETRKLPAEFDAAIHQKDERGIVVGGLCPWLTRLDEEAKPVDRKLHAALDYKTDVENEDLDALERQINERERRLALKAKLDDRGKTAAKVKEGK